MIIFYGCRKIAVLSFLTMLICFGLVNLSYATDEKISDFFKDRNISKEDSKISPLITKSLKLRDQLKSLQSENGSQSKSLNPFVKINDSGHVQVYLHLSHIDEDVISELADYGFTIEIINNDLNIIQGWADQGSLSDLSQNDFITKITAPSYGITRKGSVTTEGDPVLNSDDVRDMLGIDGTGVKVGVISDGVDSLLLSVLTGDLPLDVSVLEQGNGDEGTAMLETIHDIAPGAELAFSEGFSTSVAFMKSIDDLINICNVDIIVDDVGFLVEPYFQDGPVAQKVEEAISKGVIFVSAAGNSADEHYQDLYVDEDFNDNEFNLHDFGLASQGPSSISMPILVGGTAFFPSNFIAVVLQWNDPFDGSGNDYDLFLFDEDGIQLDSSTVIQNGSQDPVEVVVFENNSADIKPVNLVINRFSGEPRVLEMQFNGVVLIEDFNVAEDSIYGHAAARNSIAVGAVDASDPDDIEPFSSLGPVTIYSNPVQVTNSLNSSSPLIETSNNVPLEIRQKPDVVAPDGTNTSLPGFSPFFGTSVSAPHVAGVLALMIEADPGLTETSGLNSQFNETNIVTEPNAFINILKQTAVDLGPMGNDNIFGSGRVDALAAVQEILGGIPSPPPTPSPSPIPTATPTPVPTQTPAPPVDGGSGNSSTDGGCFVASSTDYSGIYSNLLILLGVFSLVFISRYYRQVKKASED